MLFDSLEPDEIDEEALTTEAGFAQYMDLRKVFASDLERLSELSVKLILLEKASTRMRSSFAWITA